MLADWLAPLAVHDFLATHFQRAPFARPATAGRAVELVDWDLFDAVLRADGPHDVLTVAGGRLVEVPQPRAADEVRALLRTGVSTVVRMSERHDARLREVAAAFDRDLDGVTHVQLYATPAGTNSFGWHYDFEDVFVAQTRGMKDYYFRDNTVARHTRLGELLDFSVVKNERSQLMAAQLVAGDWLYIPSRWWHLVTCSEDALSMSIGVMPRAELARATAGWSARHRGL